MLFRSLSLSLSLSLPLSLSLFLSLSLSSSPSLSLPPSPPFSFSPSLPPSLGFLLHLKTREKRGGVLSLLSSLEKPSYVGGGGRGGGSSGRRERGRGARPTSVASSPSLALCLLCFGRFNERIKSSPYKVSISWGEGESGVGPGGRSGPERGTRECA